MSIRNLIKSMENALKQLQVHRADQVGGMFLKQLQVHRADQVGGMFFGTAAGTQS